MRIGPYEVEGKVGRGGTATVMVARDTRDGRRVALKLLHVVGDDERTRSRFRREFRALSRLVHPNVLRVEEWGIHEGRPWFSMELVSGADLRDAIATWSCLPPEARFAKVRDVLVQVARALAYIHDRGLVHRDVSPGNVMITVDGVVKLMDFGLVTDPGAELTTVGEIVGTVAHIAPEQLRGERVDARADLYALGTVLYQMLTGRKPFSAHTVQGWVERHLHERPRPPRELEPLVPDLLDRVCLRLLEKDPRDRFASATHLLQVLGDSDPDAGTDRWPPRTIGRTATKAWLREALEEIGAHRRGGALLLTGASGTGKTRLLDMAERVARRQGFAVARVAAGSSDRPFALLADLLDALAPATVPPVIAAALSGGAEAPAERWPVIAAFREVVEAKAPCVVLVDHLEAAAPAGRDLLEYLVRNTLELAEIPVVYVFGCEADDEAAGAAPLGSLSALERQHLGPLAAQEVEELVLAVVPEPDVAEALGRRVHEETGGSPAGVADVLTALLEHGVLRRDGRFVHLAVPLEQVTHGSLPLPSRLRSLLTERLAPLAPEARAVGRLLAVARGPLDLDVVVAATPIGEEAVMAALDDLVGAGIAVERRRQDDDIVELSHARFRDVLLDGLPPAEIADLHRQLGEALERTHRYALSDALGTLAWHFEHAGVIGKAFGYGAQAATSCMERGLFEEALRLVDRALRLEAQARAALPLSEADRRLADLRIARTRSLYHLGRWEEALAEGRRAVALAKGLRDPSLLASAETRVGYILRNRGDLEDAREHLAAALRHAEEAREPALLPRPLYHLGAVAWATGDLAEAERCWTRALAIAQEAGVRRAEGMAHNGLGILEASRGRPNEARRQLEFAADIFREVGMVAYLAIVRANLVEVHVSLGMMRRAWQLVERTIAQAREVGHEHGVAMGLVWKARLQLVLGRPEEARPTAREALRIATALGTREEIAAAQAALVEARLAIGDVDGEDSDEEIAGLVAQTWPGDTDGQHLAAISLRVRTLAARGRMDEARAAWDEHREVPLPTPVRVRANLDLARAAEALGLTDEALARYRAALEGAVAHGYRWPELVALHHLARVDAPEARAGHAAKARSLARSLASGLATQDADAFLGRRWGEPTETASDPDVAAG